MKMQMTKVDPIFPVFQEFLGKDRILGRGQALVEWCIFGSMVCLFWVLALKMADRLLARTVSESWSLFVTRQTLSAAEPKKTNLIKIDEHKVTSLPNTTVGQASVEFNGARTKTRIAIPQP